MDVQYILRSWPHNWYGIWMGTVHTTEDLPSVFSAVDPSWEPDDKDQLVTYLTQTVVVEATTWMTTCPLCPSELPTLNYQSDGVWLWPQSLAHYVVWHSVVIPDRFAEHIRRRDYTPSEAVGVPHHELPWPESWAAFRQKPEA
jgi:hypothetical protein